MKMTDNEIIKAWEKIMETGDAPIGEHWSVGTVVTTILAKETLDMLNRQKAEIERLQKLNDEIIDKLKCMTEENHKLACDKYENEIRVIKEFAERIVLIIEELVDIMFDGNEPKCRIKNCHKHSSISCDSPTCIEENKAYWKLKIYNLVKEMVGDE
jgi:hypothetical protein